MKHVTSIVVVAASLMGVEFVSGCSPRRANFRTEDAQGSRFALLAQAVTVACRPGDSTMVCCIKKHPCDPSGACGATASDVEAVVNAGARSETALERGVKGKEGEAEDDPDEGWREHCRDTYVLCRDQNKPRWVGPCYDCFRLCEGQRQWPFTLCWQKTR
ncbi:hypothetical protein [Melittangium boletus]|uniref:hypothetical protein n=1 Tax=Melittangium boletus TaxID=83453 RepID=UPI003DA4F009